MQGAGKWSPVSDKLRDMMQHGEDDAMQMEEEPFPRHAYGLSVLLSAHCQREGLDGRYTDTWESDGDIFVHCGEVGRPSESARSVCGICEH